MSVLYMRPGAGNNANDATSRANAVRGFNNGITTERTVPGDEIRIEGVLKGSVSGCSITAGSGTLTLPGGNHKLLNDCESTTGWTAATNITIATSTNRVNGSNSLQFTPAAGFTTGLFADYDFGADQDLSAFSAVHAFIDLGASQQIITLKMYSDSGKSNLVATLTYDGKAAWVGYQSALFKNGASLPSQVRVLSFEINTDPGTTALRMDAVFACHDPAVTPNSLTPWAAFSTNSSVSGNFSTANDCSFQAIRHFLTDTTATLLGTGLTGVQTGCLWPHATLSSGTIYVWHAEQNDRLDVSNNNAVNTIQEAGTSSAISHYSGGWNRTDMTSQDTDGMSVFMISNFVGSPMRLLNFTKVSRCIFIGCNAGGPSGQAFGEFDNCAFLGVVVSPGVFTGNTDTIFRNIIVAGSPIPGGLFAGERNKYIGIKITSTPATFSLAEGLQAEDIWVRRSASYGLVLSSGSCRQGYNMRKVNVSDSSTADLRCTITGASVKIYDATLSGTNKLSVTAGSVLIQNYNGDSTAVFGAANGIVYSRDTATVDSGASASVRLQVNSNTYSSGFPLYWEIGTYNHALGSINGQSCSISMRLKKSHATNIAARLEVKRGVILAEDAVTTLSDNTNWNTVTVSFTPTADGPIEVYLELWSTATTESVYYDPDSLIVTVAGVTQANKNHRFNYGVPVVDQRANYSDPGIANVKTGTEYKYESSVNNKTGTLSASGAAGYSKGRVVNA